MTIAERVQQLRPTAVNAILGEVRQLQAAGVDVVSLMRGEPDFSTPDFIVQAAIESLQRGRTAYPNNQGEPTLRRAVADHIQDRFAVEACPQSEVLITSGATLGVYAALAAILNDGDEVVLPEPVYDAYHSVILQVGGVPRSVPAVIQDGRFVWRAADVAEACGERTRALIVNTPWNPTGTVFTRNELTDLLVLAERQKLTVISDEIYDQFIYCQEGHVSPLELGPAARQRTVLVNSLSKTYAMTGWRLGYCLGPAEIISAMYLVLQQSSRGPAMFVQDAGVAALQGDPTCVTDMRREYQQRFRQVQEALAGIAGVHVLIPQGGFFAIVDVRGLNRSSNEIRQFLLQEHHVVVMHGSAYGPAAEGTLRVAFASGGDKLTQGLGRLRQGLQALSTQVQ